MSKRIKKLRAAKKAGRVLGQTLSSLDVAKFKPIKFDFIKFDFEERDYLESVEATLYEWSTTEDDAAYNNLKSK